MRFFNTTGPCNATRHYMLTPEIRMPDLEPYFQQELYFVVHAARQTGKTTAMRAFAARMRERGVAAVWATLETSQGVTETQDAEPLWLEALQQASQNQLSTAQQCPEPADFLSRATGNRLNQFLRAWAQKLTVPLVLLLDEADVLSGPALISFLRQLRAGFMDRGIGQFPTSVGLIGMRDLRDYLTHAKDGVPANPGSPFNIKKASLTLRNFTQAEVGELYVQHTHDTGQVFTPEAVERAFYWTRGQPFLVNALAAICVEELVKSGEAITEDHINLAKERLILSRTTHLDSLGQRLRDARVAPVVQAVLLGDLRIPFDHDDWQYCVDLGLLHLTHNGAEVTNPLYREVLARELTFREQMNLRPPWWRWQTADGGLDMPALMEAFFEWWRENAEMVEASAVSGYLEAVPHLAFMAFLQRVVNGGGRVLREYAGGREALDIVVEYGKTRHVVELKRVPPAKVSPATVKRKGIAQLAAYLDTLGETEGWLIIFDQRPNQTWEQRLWCEETEVSGKRIFIRGG